MPEIKIYCQICKTHIAMANLEDLAAPLLPKMFRSPRPGNGFFEPFPIATCFLELFCPVCRKRAFIRADQVMTKKPNGREIIIDVNKLREDMDAKEERDKEEALVSLQRRDSVPGADAGRTMGRGQEPEPDTGGRSANATDPEAEILEDIQLLRVQGKTPTEIGKMFGLSRQKVTRMLMDAEKK